MDNPEKIAYKVRLKEFGLSLIGERIAAARTAMDQAQESANSEGKSSAGDKYETGRAMGHLQRDMFARQLGEYSKEQAALHAVNVEMVYAAAGPGAVVDCGSVPMPNAGDPGKPIARERAKRIADEGGKPIASERGKSVVDRRGKPIADQREKAIDGERGKPIADEGGKPIADERAVLFFIAAGLGKQVVEGRTVLFLSPQAPLARMLFGKGAGAAVGMNGTNYVITEVY